MSKLHNPVLRGFHPDPSLLRVGHDYYLAVSTFEWFPGILLYHSQDLSHWEQLPSPLQSREQLDLAGTASSMGVWAPDLSWHEGVFYLVYTVVRAMEANAYDTLNYLVTARDINGPWSQPVFLNALGFDPSMYHEGDRHYLLSMMLDHQPRHQKFGGIVLQEYNARQQQMVPGYTRIFYKQNKLVEGPHIYRHNGWYYLLLAVGGTGRSHSEWVCRSRSLTGPYEEYAENPILTAKNQPGSVLKKTGHLSLCDTPSGDWFGAFLCARPLERNEENNIHCPLGRETGIEALTWTEDGWLRLKNGGITAGLEVETGLPEHPFPAPPVREDFDSPVLPLRFQSSRLPLTGQQASLSARPGWLRLYGGQSIGSRYEQSLLVRRWQEMYFTAATRIDFKPENFKQMAGLVCMYNTENYYYLHITHDEDRNCRGLRLLRTLNRAADYPLPFVELPPDGAVELRVNVARDTLRFFWRTDG